MRPILPVLLAASTFLAGCASVVEDPFEPRIDDDWTCPSYDTVRVEVRVDDAQATLREVTFLAYSGYRTMLSCIAPPSEHTLPANASAAAIGIVTSQAYEEIRLVFHDRVVRAAVPMPLTENGTLTVALPERTEKTGPLGLQEQRVQDFDAEWNGRTLDVRAVEHHDDPRALDDHETMWDGQRLREASWTHSFLVNSTWNRGVSVEAYLTGDSSLVENREAAKGARLTLRLVDPRGHTTDTRVVTDPFGHEFIGHHLPETGEWRLEVETQPPDSGARIAWQVIVRFHH